MSNRKSCATWCNDLSTLKTYWPVDVTLHIMYIHYYIHCIDFVSRPISIEFNIRQLHIPTAQIQHLSTMTTTMMTTTETKQQQQQNANINLYCSNWINMFGIEIAMRTSSQTKMNEKNKRKKRNKWQTILFGACM